MKYIVLISLLLFSWKGQAQSWQNSCDKKGEYLGTCIVETYDAGFLLTTQHKGAFINSQLVKIDVNGRLLWQKYTDYHSAIFKSVARSDGSALLGINSYLKNDSQSYPVIQKIDACGDTIWSALFSDSVGSSQLFELYESPDKDIFAIIWNYNPQPSILFCLDSNGRYKWSFADSMEMSHINFDSKRNIIVSGRGKTGYTTVTLLSPNGKTIWSDIYGKDIQKYGADGLPFETKAGSYVSFHTNYDPDFMKEGNFYMVRLSSKGKEEKVQYFGDTTSFEGIMDGAAVNDSTYILAGKSGKDESGAASLHLIKINSQGKILKVKNYDLGAQYSCASTIRRTHDAKFIICGVAETTLSSPIYTFAVKINENLDLDSIYSHFISKYDYRCTGKIDTSQPLRLMHNYRQINVDSLSLYTSVIEKPVITERNAIVYPNPCREFITVYLPEAEKASVCMWDMAGRVVFLRRIEGFTSDIDLTGVKNGIYLLRIITPEGTETKRIIKQ